MQKKLFIRILALTLIFTMLAPLSVALAWSCPSCSTSNSGNFCTNCGTKKPVENRCASCGTDFGTGSYNFCPSCGAKVTTGGGASGGSTTPGFTGGGLGGSGGGSGSGSGGSGSGSGGALQSEGSFKITGISLNSDGTVSISWTDPGNNGPYMVCRRQKESNDFSADMAGKNLTWRDVDETNSTYATVEYCIPGVDYWIIIYDKNDNIAYKAYTPSAPAHFSEFGIDIGLDMKTRQGTKYNEYSAFSSATIANHSHEWSFGAYIKLTYPQLKKARNYRAQVAITAPTGVVITDNVYEEDLPSGRSYSYWTFYSFDWFFARMSQIYGSVPSGTYTWTLYYDGKYVNSQTFRISN